MIMTYDFIMTAKRNKNFRSQIEEAVLSDSNNEICTDICRLTFFPESQAVIVTANSDSGVFKHKIIPKKITYRALRKMLNGEWDSIVPGDIEDFDGSGFWY